MLIKGWDFFFLQPVFRIKKSLTSCAALMMPILNCKPLLLYHFYSHSLNLKVYYQYLALYKCTKDTFCEEIKTVQKCLQPEVSKPHVTHLFLHCGSLGLKKNANVLNK